MHTERELAIEGVIYILLIIAACYVGYSYVKTNYPTQRQRQEINVVNETSQLQKTHTRLAKL